MSKVLIVASKTTPPQFQTWLDAVVEAARTGSPGDWPHAHPDVPRTRITPEAFEQAIADNFGIAGEPWSLAAQGLPPLPGEPSPPGLDSLQVDPDDPDPDPNKGSSYHNLMHSLLGDFH